MRSPAAPRWFRHWLRHRAAWLLVLAVLGQACGGGSKTTGPTGPTEVVLPLVVRGAEVPASCSGELVATGPGLTQRAILPPFEVTLSLAAGVWTLTATISCQGQTATGSTSVTVVPPNPVNVSVQVNARGTLTVTTIGNGSVSVSPGGEPCGASCHRYFIGTVVSLAATPGPNATFTGWSGGGCSGTGQCQVTIGTAGIAVTATFSTPGPTAPGPFPLAVTIVGAGVVTSAPAGIACSSGTCSASFSSGTAVTLTATPSAGSTVSGWSVTGAPPCPGTGTCTVTMTASIAVTAVFTRLPIVTIAGTTVATGCCQVGTIQVSRDFVTGAPLTVIYSAPCPCTLTSVPPPVGSVTIPGGAASANFVLGTSTSGRFAVTVTITPDPAYVVGSPGSATVGVSAP